MYFYGFLQIFMLKYVFLCINMYLYIKKHKIIANQNGQGSSL